MIAIHLKAENIISQSSPLFARGATLILIPKAHAKPSTILSYPLVKNPLNACPNEANIKSGA